MTTTIKTPEQIWTEKNNRIANRKPNEKRIAVAALLTGKGIRYGYRQISKRAVQEYLDTASSKLVLQECRFNNGTWGVEITENGKCIAIGNTPVEALWMLGAVK